MRVTRITGRDKELPGDTSEVDHMVIQASRDILELFDGKKETAAVLQQSLDLYRIRIEPEILVALYRHGVLTRKKLDIEKQLV